MSIDKTVKTDRLILRPWTQEDLEPFSKLNADPRVREFFPSVKSYEESTQEYNLIREGFEQYGWGFWAASLIKTNEFIGFIGLKHVNPILPFAPAVEIGWRLAYDFWGKGYATEGAIASLRFGFITLDLNEIVSYTPVANTRSRNVMEKIGMHRSQEEDFEHPQLNPDDKLRLHVLYRLQRQEWKDIKNERQA